MKNLRSIFQVFSADLFSKIIMGIGVVLLIRYMPQDEYSTYTVALSLTTVLSQTLATCFNRVYILRFDRLGLDADQTPFLGVQLMTILAIALACIPFKGVLGGAYWFAAILALASILSEFSKTSFQKKMLFIRFSFVEMTRSIIFLGLILGIVWMVGSRTRAWTILFAQATAMLLAFAFVSTQGIQWSQLFQFKKAFRLSKEMLSKEYRVIFGYFFVLSIFSQIDVFMLKWLTDPRSVATFGAASRYYNLLLLSLGAIHTVLLPMLQKVTSLTEWRDLLRQLNRLLLLFIPVVLLGAWAAGWIMPWIDHGKYPEAVVVFRILALSTIISFAFSPYVNLLMRFEDFRFLFLLICAASIIATILHTILIPPFGPKGAAIATLSSFALVNLATFLRARVHYQRFSDSPLPAA